MDKSIIPECYADTLLIETLVPTKKGYNHQRCCTKVEATVKNTDAFALGIIDKDKRQIEYLSEFEKVDEVEGKLILWRHKDSTKHHWFIQICPALERWIIDVSEMEQIDLSDFGEDRLYGIKYYTKSLERKDDPKMKSVFSQIKAKSENLSVRKLSGWVRILKEKNYSVDINELRNV